MSTLRQSHRTRGFTLVELLIVIVLIGIVLTIALPRAGGVRQRMQLDAAAQQLAGDLRRAKIEALKRNRSVRVLRMSTSTYTIDFVGDGSLEGGVLFSSGPDSLRFASFGPPASGPATYTLTLGSRTKTVIVNAAGLVDVR